MKNVMIDLETLSTQPSAHILSIGACEFGAEGIGEKHHWVITPTPQPGAHIDPETIHWWFSQSREAQTHLLDVPQVSLEIALQAFTIFCCGLQDKILVWGNGADFDNVILANAFQRSGLKAPWAFYNNRCYRTVKSLFPIAKKFSPDLKHNALSDAVSQALHLIAIRNSLLNGGVESYGEIIDCGSIDLFDSSIIKRLFSDC